MGEGLGEERLRAGVADQPQRQDGDRRPVRRRHFAQLVSDWCRGRRFDLDGLDETEAAAVDGTDQLLRPAVVPQRAARRLDAAGQRRFRYDPAVPDLLDHFVAGDESIALVDQQEQKRQDLWLDRNARSALAQLEACAVELERAEAIDHLRTLAGGRLSMKSPRCLQASGGADE